ncbi:hypothetical protein ACWCQS_39130 [Streptomyces sp. NPDC002076]
MTTPPLAGREASQILGPPGAIRLRQVAPSRLGHHLETLAQLAHAAYTPRPWHATPAEITRLLDRLTHDAQHLGFTLVLADDPAGRPFGFAYGRPPATSPPWPTGHRRAPPFLSRCVNSPSPPLPGHGIGAALHDTLIATTPPGPRWLITLPNGTIRILMHRPA